MNCPSCGKEMEPGRMTAGGYNIRWVPKGKSTTLFSMFDDQTVTISGTSFSSKGVPAYLCLTCRNVIAKF